MEADSSLLAAVTWDLSRIVGVVSIAITALLLMVAVLACRRPSPVRLHWDLARMVLSAIAIVVMASITGVSTPGAAIGLAIAAGVLLGSAQGWFSRLEVVEGRVLTHKTVWGIAAWAIGVLVMQTAGVASRTGALKLGQTISWLGLGLLVGTVLGRQQRIAETRPRAGAIVAVIVLGVSVVAGLPLASAVSAAPGDWAAADPGLRMATPAAGGPLTAEELCGLFPTDEGLSIAADSGACFGQRGSLQDEGTFLSVSVGAAGDAEEARATLFDSGIPETWSPIPDLGDAAFLTFNEDYYTYVLRGPYLFYGWAAVGQEDAMLAVIADIDRKLEILLEEGAAGDSPEPEPVQPEPEPVQPEPEPVQPEPEPVAPEPVEPAPGPESGDGDAAVVVPLPSPTGDDEEISSAEALGTTTAGLIASGLVGLISLVEAGGLATAAGRERRVPPDFVIGPRGGTAASGPAGSGALGNSPVAKTTTIYVTGAEAERIISKGAGSVMPIPDEQQWGQNVSVPGERPAQTDHIGSHGVVRSVGPIVRGPDGVSIAVEVDPFTLPEPKPITGPEPDLPEPLPPRPPPRDEAPPGGEVPPIPELPPIDESIPAEWLQPDDRPLVEGDLWPEDEPFPAQWLQPDERPLVEGDLWPEDEPFPAQWLQPDDKPLVEGDLWPEDEPFPAQWLQPDDEVPGAGEAPLADEAPPDGQRPSDHEPTGDEHPDGSPDGLADPDPAVGNVPEPPPIDEEPPAPDGEVSDAAPDVRLTPQEIEHIVRWGLGGDRSYSDILADLEAANRGVGGSGPVELPEWYDREAEDLIQSSRSVAEAPLEMDRLREERENLRERIAELNREAGYWTALEQAPDVRFVGGLRDVAQQQANYEGARAELIAERARLEDLGGSEAEIEEVDRQLEAIEEDHRLTMGSTGAVGGEVEPAEGVDRGTWFDRPARELERIARERDELLGQYRSLDQELEDLQRFIEESEGGADR